MHDMGPLELTPSIPIVLLDFSEFEAWGPVHQQYGAFLPKLS